MTDRDRVGQLHRLVSGIVAQCRRRSEINANWTEPHRLASDAVPLIEAIRLAIERGDSEEVQHFADMTEAQVAAAAKAIRPVDPDTANSLNAERRMLNDLRGYQAKEGDTPGYSRVVEIIGDPELVEVFLTEEQGFADEVARPIDKLRRGEIEDVVGAALSFGSAPT